MFRLWKDYYYRTLGELQEPLIEHKICLDNRNVILRKDYNSKYFWYALRKSLENAFRFRNLMACIVDETKRLHKVSGAKSLQNQLDTIKRIQFPRYRAINLEDYCIFLSVIHMLQKSCQ